MFNVIGVVNGTTYTGKEELSGADMVKLFPEVKRHVEGQVLEFDGVGKRKRFDRQNNAVMRSKGSSLVCEFSGSYKGASVTVRFYERRRPDENGNNIYYPARLTMSGNKVLTPSENLDRAVFFILHTWCQDSPIRAQTTPTYGIVDRQKDAEKFNAWALEESKVRGEIAVMYENRPNELRRRVSGIKINGNSYGRMPSYVSDQEVLQKAFQLLEQHKVGFVKAWRSPETDVRGMIHLAIDRNILVLSNQPNDRGVKWKSNNEIVVRTTETDDPVSVLLQHALTNPERIIPQLKEALAGKDISKLATDNASKIASAMEEEVAPDENSTRTLAQEAMKAGVIKFLPASGTVVYGHNDKVILEGVTAESWETQMAKLLVEKHQTASAISKRVAEAKEAV